MSDVFTRVIEEACVEGKRLGRHIEHDPKSKEYGIDDLVRTGVPLADVVHVRHGGPLNQGQLGSCTGNATAGSINTEPIYVRHRSHLLHEKDAISIYELATQLDNVPGSYPPDDTGSSGLAAAKAARERGWIKSFHHAFGIDQALAALQVTDVITGIDWYESFDSPDPQGLVQISGQIRGGHEVHGFEYVHNATDPLDAIVGFWNSWGKLWGVGGKFYMTVRTWGQLLAEQGDVTVLVK